MLLKQSNTKIKQTIVLCNERKLPTHRVEVTEDPCILYTQQGDENEQQIEWHRQVLAPQLFKRGGRFAISAAISDKDPDAAAVVVAYIRVVETSRGCM